mgnify:CR=1 FL=1
MVRILQTPALIGNGSMQVHGLTTKSKTMGKEKVTVNDLKGYSFRAGSEIWFEAGKDYSAPAG